jgi:hypothetical protein
MKKLFPRSPFLIFATVGAVFLMLYISTFALLYFQQQRLIFQPKKDIVKTPKQYGSTYQEIFIPVAGDRGETEKINAWWLPAKNAKQPEKVLLYLHGCCNNISSDIDQAKLFQKLGFSILLIDYRGYGRSEGAFPSELQSYADASAAWNYLREKKQVKPKQILIYGVSLGGAIAIELATKNPDAMGLIIESSFSSMREMIGERPIPPIYPFDLILHQKFDSIAKVKTLIMPILFLHGTSDRTVPYRMTEELYSAAASSHKQMTLIPKGGHLNSAMYASPLYWQSVRNFISKL